MDRYSQYITAHGKPKEIEDPEHVELIQALDQLEAELEQQYNALDESTEPDKKAMLVRTRAALRTARSAKALGGIVGAGALYGTTSPIGPIGGAAAAAAGLALAGAGRDIANTYKMHKADILAGRKYYK
jgi:hypothetical protein